MQTLVNVSWDSLIENADRVIWLSAFSQDKDIIKGIISSQEYMPIEL